MQSSPPSPPTRSHTEQEVILRIDSTNRSIAVARLFSARPLVEQAEKSPIKWRLILVSYLLSNTAEAALSLFLRVNFDIPLSEPRG